MLLAEALNSGRISCDDKDGNDFLNRLGEILTEFMGNSDLSVVYTGNESPDSPVDYQPVGFLA